MLTGYFTLAIGHSFEILWFRYTFYSKLNPSLPNFIRDSACTMCDEGNFRFIAMQESVTYLIKWDEIKKREIYKRFFILIYTNLVYINFV